MDRIKIKFGFCISAIDFYKRKCIFKSRQYIKKSCKVYYCESSDCIHEFPINIKSMAVRYE